MSKITKAGPQAMRGEGEQKMKTTKTLIKVLKRPVIGSTEKPAWWDETDIPMPFEPDPIYGEARLVEMTYEDVCRELGMIPDIHFVEITGTGRITYTCGKESEIKALRHAVDDHGYVYKHNDLYNQGPKVPARTK